MQTAALKSDRTHSARLAVSNGTTENPNLKTKNTKRIARGYRGFEHYRLRLLLNHSSPASSVTDANQETLPKLVA
jgi:hypothetical protein